MNNPNTPLEKSTKKVRAKNNELLYGFREVPLPMAVIEKWIQDLKDYSKLKPTPRSMTGFLRSLGYTEKTFYEKCKQYPSLKEQYLMTKEEIGYKLWEDCVDRGKNWPAAKFLIHEYGENFAKAKAEEKTATEQGKDRIVILPQIPTPKEEK